MEFFIVLHTHKTDYIVRCFSLKAVVSVGAVELLGALEQIEVFAVEAVKEVSKFKKFV